jgi:hypothetical protein
MPKVQLNHHRTALRKRHIVKQPSLAQIVLGIIAILGFCILLTTITISMLTSYLQTTSRYSLQSQPTISASFINRVLAHYHSPASGKGQALYDDGVKYGIDPAYALAFFMYESDLGTQGVARITHSLGNIRTTSGTLDYNGYRKYTTWEAGFEDWYRLISQTYIHQRGLTTIDQIIPVYAPSSDNNNEQQYIDEIKYMVNTWRTGTITIT